MTVLARTRCCAFCGNEFSESKRDSELQWSKRSFCSIVCANSAKFEKTPIGERYLRYVIKRDGNQCWSWVGSKDGRGYGALSAGKGLSPKKAHRVSWVIHFGEIPTGLSVLHKCDNPECSNPDHLFLGTQKDNALDMSRKGRMNPISYLNLRPGNKGIRGAGSKSLKELANGIGK